MNDTHPKKRKVGLREIASAANVSVPRPRRSDGNGGLLPIFKGLFLRKRRRFEIDPHSAERDKSLAFLLSNRAMLNVFHSRILVGAEQWPRARVGDGVSLFQLSLLAPSTELHLPKVVQRHDVTRAVVFEAYELGEPHRAATPERHGFCCFRQ